MSDIVNDPRRYQPGETPTDVIDRLAAEIERLRSENQTAWNKADELDERARHAEAEIRRLRAALQELASDAYHDDDYQVIARRALEGTSRK